MFFYLSTFQSDRKKSKAEVMAELIAKSKKHKVMYDTFYRGLPNFRLGSPSTAPSAGREYATSTGRRLRFLQKSTLRA